MENDERVWAIRLYVCSITLLGTFGLMNIIYPLVTGRPHGGVLLGAAIYWGLLGNIAGLFPWPPWRTTRR